MNIFGAEGQPTTPRTLTLVPDVMKVGFDCQPNLISVLEVVIFTDFNHTLKQFYAIFYCTQLTTYYPPQVIKTLF